VISPAPGAVLGELTAAPDLNGGIGEQLLKDLEEAVGRGG